MKRALALGALAAALILPSMGLCQEAMPAVDIYSQSMADYVVAGGSTTYMMKARSAAYLAQLKRETEFFVGRVRRKVAASTTLSATFDEIYKAFTIFAHSAAVFGDSVRFHNLSTGEFSPGTALGLTQMGDEAALYWQFLGSCLIFLQGDETSRFSFPPALPGTETSVGGYNPVTGRQSWPQESTPRGLD